MHLGEFLEAQDHKIETKIQMGNRKQKQIAGFILKRSSFPPAVGAGVEIWLHHIGTVHGLPLLYVTPTDSHPFLVRFSTFFFQITAGYLCSP